MLIDHEKEATSEHLEWQIEYYPGPPLERCQAEHDSAHPITGAKVVLTVAHLNHQPENCNDANLKAMCQRCHNRYDAPKRRQGIQERERAKRASGDLFGEQS